MTEIVGQAECQVFISEVEKGLYMVNSGFKFELIFTLDTSDGI